jgi:hypothetical protein
MAFNKSSAASFFPRPFPFRGERFLQFDFTVLSVSIVKIDEFAVVFLQAVITFCITITQSLSQISESNGSPTVKYAISVLLSDLITLS